MATLAIAAATSVILAASFDRPRVSRVVSVRKVGGIWFARAGFLRFSFCVARR